MVGFKSRIETLVRPEQVNKVLKAIYLVAKHRNINLLISSPGFGGYCGRPCSEFIQTFIKASPAIN